MATDSLVLSQLAGYILELVYFAYSKYVREVPKEQSDSPPQCGNTLRQERLATNCIRSWMKNS